jgi:hypothetical protein
LLDVYHSTAVQLDDFYLFSNDGQIFEVWVLGPHPIRDPAAFR